jgi:hypothetical protein
MHERAKRRLSKDESHQSLSLKLKSAKSGGDGFAISDSKSDAIGNTTADDDSKKRRTADSLTRIPQRCIYLKRSHPPEPSADNSKNSIEHGSVEFSYNNDEVKSDKKRVGDKKREPNSSDKKRNNNTLSSNSLASSSASSSSSSLSLSVPKQDGSSAKKSSFDDLDPKEFGINIKLDEEKEKEKDKERGKDNGKDTSSSITSSSKPTLSSPKVLKKRDHRYSIHEYTSDPKIQLIDSWQSVSSQSNIYKTCKVILFICY